MAAGNKRTATRTVNVVGYPNIIITKNETIGIGISYTDNFRIIDDIDGTLSLQDLPNTKQLKLFQRWIIKKFLIIGVILTPSLVPNNNKYYLEITTNDENDNSLKPFTDNMDPSLFGENGTTILENLFKNYISSEIFRMEGCL